MLIDPNRRVVDMMGNELWFADPPQRIVSLVPSQTELLYSLGLGDRVVGITKFCIHPEEWYRSKTRIGGTKKLNLDKIRALEPDLIIGNKEENERSDIEALQKDFPVWMSDIHDVDEALSMMRKVGDITRTLPTALDLIEQIQEKRTKLSGIGKGKSALYFIWKDPYMVAASNTYIDALLTEMGFANAIKSERYPELTKETIQKINPDLILLSSEPYPFKETHMYEFQAMCKNAKIKIVDGEYYSWYGSRMLEAFDQFTSNL